jgi:hypothetical protein
VDPHQDILQSISSVGAYNDIKYRLVTESRNRVNLNAFGLFFVMHAQILQLRYLYSRTLRGWFS